MDYSQEGNRWTMIIVRDPQPGGGELYRRAPFDLVRFNVDKNPSVTPVIVPLGPDNPNGPSPDSQKKFEKIWFVDTVPYREFMRFNRPVE